MKVIIMAGGKGTRVSGIADDVPKPMIKIAGKPVLEHQIECLRRQGFDDITISIGYKGDVIKSYFGDSIKYIEEDKPLGTAGALYYLHDKIDDDILLINGDVIFDISLQRFITAHHENERDFNKRENKTSSGFATIFTHPNDHPYDSGIVIADTNGRVTQWLTKEDERKWYKNRVNAGLHILSPALIKCFTQKKKVDLDRDILKPLIKENALYIYDSPEYVKDMGTPERIQETEQAILNGVVAAKNLENKQTALLIDRDGTINKYVKFLNDINNFEIINEAVDMIKTANREGKLVIVITNQPVIARGDLTWEELHEIHNKMETLLGEKGAFIDDIFICPHHPDKGFDGERVEYKIDCECRKPKPGLILQAAKKYNLDLAKSTMVGDRETDIEAGRKAGVGNLVLVNYE
ncbi:MAG: HAD-IIIA family hydrolase [Oscillospiraceae bacterium]|jgi:D-glycero-D-manno-heptose 1,7-bisphosphate phosphatase|nr:HAD-IIIA family hydrolase [Oscillospiraceae bacterium]